jgi:hypothetical protein
MLSVQRLSTPPGCPRRSEPTSVSTPTGTILITTGGAAQRPIWMRSLSFLCVGWLCDGGPYLLCLTIILLPVGLMIFNRVPAVMTLQRN